MRRCASLLALLALASWVTAQTFRERVDIELVRVDLLATDAQGRPVQGLRPGDIQIKVDGRTVRIESFEAPALPASAAEPVGKAPEPSRAPAPSTGESWVTPAPPAPHSIYSMAILVDETSSEQSNRRAMHRQLLRFLENGLPRGVEVLLMRFDGRLHIESPWTSDLELLHRTALAMSQRPAVSRVGPPGHLSIAPPGFPGSPGLDSLEARGHIRTSQQGLFDALRAFPERPGRKAIFFVSDGAPFLSYIDVSRALVATTASSVSANSPDAEGRARLEAGRDRDLLLDSLAWDRRPFSSLMTEIERLALLRGIEINPVRAAPHDLGGRISADQSGASLYESASSPSPNPLRNGLAIPMTDIAASQGMEQVADMTGGTAVLSRRFFEDRLRDEMEMKDAAYLLTFRDPFSADHRFHRIEISTRRDGIALRYRRGYRILDVRESLIQATVNRLHAPADANPLGARLDFAYVGQDKGRAVAEITVAYPAPPEAGGRARENGGVQVLGICARRDGLVSEPIDLSGAAELVPYGAETWVTRSGRIGVPAGAYRWSFAVRDERTGITSYLTFERKVP